MGAEPGWYPDPGGQPDRYRFYDGGTWSTQTTDGPHRALPGSAPSPRGQLGPAHIRPRHRLAALAAAVVVVVGSLVLGWPPAPLPPSRFLPLAGASDEPGPSVGVGGPGLPKNRPIDCPDGAPDARAPHPDDGRVHGGSLSFPRVASFRSESTEPRMDFAYDLVQQVRTVSVDPPWVAQLSVGRLVADGYPRDARHTAEHVTACVLASAVYRDHAPVRRDRESRPITVGQTDGWLLTTEVVVGLRGLGVPGDQVTVVVVPDGADWGIFVGTVPIGNEALAGTVRATVTALRTG